MNSGNNVIKLLFFLNIKQFMSFRQPEAGRNRELMINRDPETSSG